jgi:hypothetical protein
MNERADSTRSLHRALGVTYPNSPGSAGKGKPIETNGAATLTLAEGGAGTLRKAHSPSRARPHCRRGDMELDIRPPYQCDAP